MVLGDDVDAEQKVGDGVGGDAVPNVFLARTISQAARLNQTNAASIATMSKARSEKRLAGIGSREAAVANDEQRTRNPCGA